MHGRYGYREVTVAAVAYGVIFGAIMNAAITYMGLKIGFTLGGGSIAAVVGFGVLRGILRRGSILETKGCDQSGGFAWRRDAFPSSTRRW